MCDALVIGHGMTAVIPSERFSIVTRSKHSLLLIANDGAYWLLNYLNALIHCVNGIRIAHILVQIHIQII